MSELAELAARLVAIDSVNPDLVPGAAGEAEIGRFVAGWFEEAGLEVDVLEGRPGRPSVVGLARGSGAGRTLMLNGHLDTVSLETMERPLEPRVEGGRLYGRGAYDMKGSLAALMLAGRAAARLSLRGNVLVAAVADEEAGSIGTEEVLGRYRADAAIVAEPTALQVGVAHKGFVGFEIETMGRAAHGSRPDLGIDAIARMGPIIVALEELDRSLRANHSHPLLGSGSLHTSFISGGQEFSSYPERCLLQGERRTIPGEGVAAVQGELQSLLRGRHAGLRTTLARGPFETASDGPFVALVRRLAGDAPLSGQPFWADSALLAAAGIPTGLFGPGGDGAHAAVEWVELGDLERCLEVYLGVAGEFCA